MRERIEQLGAVNARRTCRRQRLRQRNNGLKEHHVIELLEDLPRPDIAAMHDLGRERPHHGCNPIEQISRSAKQRDERASFSRLPGPRDWCIRIAHAVLRKGRRQIARQRHRRSAVIDYRLTGPRVGQKAAFIAADGLQFSPAGQAKMQHVNVIDQCAKIISRDDTKICKVRRGARNLVVGPDRANRAGRRFAKVFACNVGAHRPAHRPKPDKSNAQAVCSASFQLIRHLKTSQGSRLLPTRRRSRR